jgi:hypothetical protein
MNPPHSEVAAWRLTSGDFKRYDVNTSTLPQTVLPRIYDPRKRTLIEALRLTDLNDARRHFRRQLADARRTHNADWAEYAGALVDELNAEIARREGER